MKLKTDIILPFILFLFIFNGNNVFADNEEEKEVLRYTISGHVRDAQNGEELLGATVFVEELKNGTTTNNYGFYSLSLQPGEYTLVYSYVGYKKKTVEIDLQKDMKKNIELKPSNQELNTVTVSGEREDRNISSSQMSSMKIQSKTFEKIPALMGEIDVLKTLQLLPGVQSAGEGSTGFSVRGGSRDQNLVLLDEATVFNASHLMGFFSVFNNDAIKEVELYKGDIPARHGGRLSSLVDIRQKDGNMKKFQVDGGLGTISSRLTVQGPIKKEETSFLIAGRRSYADIFLPLAADENLHDNTLYFYDLNFKLNHILNENNRFYVSQYYGRDVIKIGGMNDDPFSMSWGNITTTVRWNHLFSDKLFSNFTFVRSGYDYKLGIEEANDNITSFMWRSNLGDNTLKADFGYYINPNNTVRFGANASYKSFEPGKVKGLSEESIFGEVDVPASNALSYSLYASNEQKIGEKLTLNYGLRYTLFQNIGKATVYNFDENYNTIDSTVYGNNEIFNSYDGFSPRISFKYQFNDKSSIKSSYSRTLQFIHLASNATVGTPLDIWLPSSPNIEPQRADQAAIGYFRNFLGNAIETSVEVYYKKMHNQIDFKDHAQIFLNPEIEGDMRFGEAEAYGAEFLIRKVKGKFTGWISYTLAHAERTFEEINDGEPYVSPFNRKHDISVILNYELNKRFSFGMNWVYASGKPVTFPTGRWEYGNMVAPVYSERNTYRMPDYHRLDLSITYDSKNKDNEDKRFYSSWNLSVYNVYDRHNAFSISFEDVQGSQYEREAIKTYLFGIIPSITYNFHFK
ncbi:MAG: TonB-dependent receptor [Bacteroidales bacterium]|nr:TonB-dependent receptor [Bacteroidales bacterium]MCF8326666.1 TonB-dependent receptor [Bacteroidales bacterium]